MEAYLGLLIINYKLTYIVSINYAIDNINH